MNKFALNLKRSHKEIKAERADRIAKSVENAQNQLVAELEGKKYELQNRLDDLLDLNATHTTSLEFKSIEDGSTYVRNLHSLKLQIAEVDVELEIALETKEDLFSTIEVKSKSTRATKAEKED